MAEPVVIGFGVNKWVKDTDTKMIYLSNTSAINITGQDMETAAAGAALSGYTIPVGKKFVLLRVQVMVYSTTAKEGVIINERYGGTNYFKIRHALNNSTGENESRFIETYAEFQAGSTVYCYTYAGGFTCDVAMLGVETNA